MKNKISALCFFVFLVPVSVLGAELSQPSNEGLSHQEYKNVRPPASYLGPKLSLGYRLSLYGYQEPSVMNQFGVLQGVALGFDHGWRRFLFQFEGEVLAGRIQYDGAYQGGAPLKAPADDVSYLVATKFGFFALDGQRTQVAPFFGYGVRGIWDRIRAKGGYERQIRQSFVPIGAIVRRQLSSQWLIQFTGEIDVFQGGTVESRVSQAGLGYPDAFNEQKVGSGSRWNFKVAQTGRQGPELWFDVFLQVWSIGESEPYFINERDVFFEPRNDTQFLGASIGINL